MAKRYEFGGYGCMLISGTTAHNAPHNYKFIAVVAHTDVTIASTGTNNVNGMASSSQTVAVTDGNILYGEHTLIRLTTGGTAMGYYGA